MGNRGLRAGFPSTKTVLSRHQKIGFCSSWATSKPMPSRWSRGAYSGWSRAQANQWIDVLLLALLVALRAVGDAPARSRSCPCRLRINLSGPPVYRDRSTKAWTRELSWLPSGPLSPGDALDAGRPDTCHLLRSPLFAVSSHRSLLTAPLAGATAARKRAALRAGSTHGRSAQRPSLACAAAAAWPSRCHGWVRTVATAGVRRRVANRNYSTHDTMRAAGVSPPHPCRGWSPVAPPRRHAGGC